MPMIHNSSTDRMQRLLDTWAYLPQWSWLMFGLILCATLVGCEEIAIDQRWTVPSEIRPARNVLVEEYTGQRCPNCPPAAAQWQQWQQTSAGAHLVVVSIHGGALAENSSATPRGLANADTEALTRQAGITAWPMASVDRGAATLSGTWAELVTQRLGRLPEAELTMDNRLILTTRDLNIDTQIKTAIPDPRLTIYLVEDSIRSTQIMSDGQEQKDYLHRHVLRGIITPIQGEMIEKTSPAGGGWTTVHHHVVLPKGYGLAEKYSRYRIDPEHLSLVAFVTAGNGGRVAAVITQKIRIQKS